MVRLHEEDFSKDKPRVNRINGGLLADTIKPYLRGVKPYQECTRRVVATCPDRLG